MSDPRRALVWKGVLEVLLITIGVLMALGVDEWRTSREHRALAHAALVRFKTELEMNRAAVSKVKDYHARLHEEIKAYLNPATRAATRMQMQGIQPVTFEHTAWDLALAMQTLADIDAALAFDLARLYGAQQTYAGLTGGMLQAMYVRPPSENLDTFLHTLRVYLDDIVGLEPGLERMYQEILPKLDAALRD